MRGEANTRSLEFAAGRLPSRRCGLPPIAKVQDADYQPPEKVRSLAGDSLVEASGLA